MTDTDSAPQPLTDAGIASAEDGLVVLDGPDGVAITMTPEAAIGTAHSLLSAAERAGTQVRKPATGA